MDLADLARALWLPLLFAAGGVYVAHRERRAHRLAERDPEAVFVYSDARLRRRTIGAATLAAIGVTLGAWELFRPGTAGGFAIVLAAIATELLVLVWVAIADLLETARHAPAPPTGFGKRPPRRR